MLWFCLIFGGLMAFTFGGFTLFLVIAFVFFLGQAIWDNG